MLLLTLMTTWVLAPFVVLLMAIQHSQGWQEFARKSLYIVTFVVAAGAVGVLAVVRLSRR